MNTCLHDFFAPVKSDHLVKCNSFLCLISAYNHLLVISIVSHTNLHTFWCVNIGKFIYVQMVEKAHNKLGHHSSCFLFSFISFLGASHLWPRQSWRRGRLLKRCRVSSWPAACPRSPRMPTLWGRGSECRRVVSARWRPTCLHSLKGSLNNVLWSLERSCRGQKINSSIFSQLEWVSLPWRMLLSLSCCWSNNVTLKLFLLKNLPMMHRAAIIILHLQYCAVALAFSTIFKHTWLHHLYQL